MIHLEWWQLLLVVIGGGVLGIAVIWYAFYIGWTRGGF